MRRVVKRGHPRDPVREVGVTDMEASRTTCRLDISTSNWTLPI